MEAGYGEKRADVELGKDKDDGDWGGGEVGCFAGGEVSVWSVWSQGWI